MSLAKLLEPGKIAGMELKNRICMAAMGAGFDSLNGGITQRRIEYYRARARGGVGLIITTAVHADLTISQGMRIHVNFLDIAHSSHIGEFSELAEAAHDYGTKVAVQLTAGGGKASSLESAPGVQPVSSSPIPSEAHPEIVPRELTISEIEYLVEAQGKAAERVKRAGIDAIEMHAHGAYLMAQFMSPVTNRRTDKYGGDLDGRLRFAMESIRAIKANVGKDFPLIFRYSIDEFVDGGRGLEESQVIAKRLEAAGIHAIDASAGVGGTRKGGRWFIPPSYLPKGAWIHLAEGIKKVVNIPVIVAGRLGDPFLAAKVLEDGKADFIAMGRPLLCDPDLPRKLAAGHPEDVRQCTSCLDCMHKHVGSGARCSLNPLQGRELNYREPVRAERKKKVVVIGAGPGGMEAARVAALRGHEVVLYEKAKQLGGVQLRLAIVPPHKEDLVNIINFYEAQFKKLENVTLKLGVEATANLVKKESPEVVIIATGGEALIPGIPGVDKANVVTAHAVLAGKAKVGNSVVIIGFGVVGCETADYLTEQGKKVSLLDIKDIAEIASDINDWSRLCLLEILAEKAVRIEGSRVITEITDQGVVTFDFHGKREFFQADTVVLASGSKSVRGLVPEIANLVAEYHVIGDAKQPRGIMEAIWEGFRCCYEL